MKEIRVVALFENLFGRDFDWFIPDDGECKTTIRINGEHRLDKIQYRLNEFLEKFLQSPENFNGKGKEKVK